MSVTPATLGTRIAGKLIRNFGQILYNNPQIMNKSI